MAVRGTIDNFKSSVVSDFARPNLFQVDLAFPTQVISNGTGLSDLGKFTVRAANLPSAQMGIIEVPFRGRVLKIAGDRTFEPWTVTIMNDSKFSLRNAFETWVEKIQLQTRTSLRSLVWAMSRMQLVTSQTCLFTNSLAMRARVTRQTSCVPISSPTYSPATFPLLILISVATMLLKNSP